MKAPPFNSCFRFERPNNDKNKQAIKSPTESYYGEENGLHRFYFRTDESRGLIGLLFRGSESLISEA